MARRELLKMMAATVDSNIALPQTVFARLGDPFDPTDLDFFRPAQRAQVAMIAEAIIPRTDTPGAIEAGVPGWIEVLVKDCFDTTDQRIIIDGLADPGDLPPTTQTGPHRLHGQAFPQLPLRR